MNGSSSIYKTIFFLSVYAYIIQDTRIFKYDEMYCSCMYVSGMEMDRTALDFHLASQNHSSWYSDTCSKKNLSSWKNSRGNVSYMMRVIAQ